MVHQGGCHCGKVSFTVEGDIEQVMECNCSICRRKGYLLWFAPREKMSLTAPEGTLSSYTFNNKAIQHMFCTTCGCAPFGFGKDPKQGTETVAVNVRCLPEVDLKALKIVPVDGKSF